MFMSQSISPESNAYAFYRIKNTKAGEQIKKEMSKRFAISNMNEKNKFKWKIEDSTLDSQLPTDENGMKLILNLY